MIIRSTIEADWETLKEIRLAALHDTPKAFSLTRAIADQYSEAQWRDRASGRTQVEYVLAFVDDVGVGMIGGFVNLALEYNMIGMWVRPAHRGVTVASGLVQAVKQCALAKGHERVVLDVSPENARAVSFYRKHGFAFLPEWEPLESYPEITLQKMEWRAGNQG